jgi:hypothetical protein
MFFWKNVLRIEKTQKIEKSIAKAPLFLAGTAVFLQG